MYGMTPHSMHRPRQDSYIGKLENGSFCRESNPGPELETVSCCVVP